MAFGEVGTRNVYVPVSIPTQILGTATRLVNVKVCYVNFNADSHIEATTVKTLGDDLANVNLIEDPTDRISTTTQCYTVSDATPQGLVGPLAIRFTLHFTDTFAQVVIGKIEVTLDEI